MHFGVVIWHTAYALPITELARALEAHGIESLWVPEHTHIPTSRRTPWGGGSVLPDEYSHMLDPFVSLAAAAAVTTNLQLGTGICLVTQRDPIITAKAVASLDHLSGGRFLFGVGAGWNREELANHGTRYETRWRLMQERVDAMKEIWTNDEAEYHGTMVSFERLWSWPKPVQKPHPPIVVAGNGSRALEHVVAYGDEWLPLYRPGARIAEQIPELRSRAVAAGRDHIPVGAFVAPEDPYELEQLAAAGVERFLLRLPPADASEVMPRITQLARLIQAFA